MSPYQRGNRDGLLNAAAYMERMRKMYADDADNMRRAPGYKPDNRTHVEMARWSDVKAATYRDVAAELIRLAEYMPEDPEDGDTTSSEEAGRVRLPAPVHGGPDAGSSPAPAASVPASREVGPPAVRPDGGRGNPNCGHRDCPRESTHVDTYGVGWCAIHGADENAVPIDDAHPLDSWWRAASLACDAGGEAWDRWRDLDYGEWSDDAEVVRVGEEGA